MPRLGEREGSKVSKQSKLSEGAILTKLGYENHVYKLIQR